MCFITNLFKKNKTVETIDGSRALLVGVNNYPNAPLRGCVNDVTNMANFLVDNGYFQSSQIRILTDERATTQNILERLDWLVTGLKAGDKVYFHYSGHGCLFAGRSKSGAVEGITNVFCPVDFDWSEDRMITDIQLVDIFEHIPSGVIFNWVSDSCHSAGLSSVTDRKVTFYNHPRSYPVPVDIFWRLKSAKELNLYQSREFINGVLDIGFLSGCKKDQTSADAFINNSYNGAFTYYLIDNLKHYKDLSLKDLMVKINEALLSAGYKQQPQAEGARTLKAWLK